MKTFFSPREKKERPNKQDLAIALDSTSTGMDCREQLYGMEVQCTLQHKHKIVKAAII